MCLNYPVTKIIYQKTIFVSFQNITSDIAAIAIDKGPSSLRGSMFALSQIFCHTCLLVTLIPQEISEQLFVLALDIMTMMEDAATNRDQEQSQLSTNGNEDKFEWTNEEGSAMQMVIGQLQDEEQRKTLTQKLCSLQHNDTTNSNRNAGLGTKHSGAMGSAVIADDNSPLVSAIEDNNSRSTIVTERVDNRGTVQGTEE